MRLRRWLTLSISLALLLSFNLFTTVAQDKPFIFPVAAPAGPSSWLFGQPYGNTVGAYNFGTQWYSAGQGLHFGVDISMPCGTPLVAVADGDVIYADNLTFGAGPHNLILRHESAGVTTLYGHLLDRPIVQQFQPVKQGDLVGYSGDPDVTCDSRPHLHFEVRSLDYRTAYNPVDYVNVNWDVLSSIGPFNGNLFQADLYNPRQWMSLDNQPQVAFGGTRLNAYSLTWPPLPENRPPATALLPRDFTPLPDVPWSLRPLGMQGCCTYRWWHPTNPDLLYMIDGSPGQPAAIFEWGVTNSSMTGLIEPVPPRWYSPDGSLEIINSNGQIILSRLADGAQWGVPTNGFYPSISPDNSRMFWEVQYGQFVPGTTPPDVQIWVSNLDGSDARQIVLQPRASARWLGNDRLLISATDRTLTTLSVYNLTDGTSFTLGTWDRLRGLSAAPGGQRVLFYQSFQADPNVNGLYLLEMSAGAVPQKLNWFGGWRWRDAESLYYIPFEPDNPVQRLVYTHLLTGETRPITDPAVTPFVALNGDWSVSADGRRIVFQNVADRQMYVLEAG